MQCLGSSFGEVRSPIVFRSFEIPSHPFFIDPLPIQHLPRLFYFMELQAIDIRALGGAFMALEFVCLTTLKLSGHSCFAKLAFFLTTFLAYVPFLSYTFIVWSPSYTIRAPEFISCSSFLLFQASAISRTFFACLSLSMFPFIEDRQHIAECATRNLLFYVRLSELITEPPSLHCYDFPCHVCDNVHFLHVSQCLVST